MSLADKGALRSVNLHQGQGQRNRSELPWMKGLILQRLPVKATNLFVYYSCYSSPVEVFCHRLSSFRSIILPDARPDLPSHSQHGLPKLLSSKSCADLSLLDPSLSLQHCWSPTATMALSHSPIGTLSPQEVREGLQPASHKVVRV